MRAKNAGVCGRGIASGGRPVALPISARMASQSIPHPRSQTCGCMIARMGVFRRGSHIQDGRRHRLRRYVWSVLIMAETANLADWISTLIGVGGLGKPELNPVAAALMR